MKGHETRTIWHTYPKDFIIVQFTDNHLLQVFVETKIWCKIDIAEENVRGIRIFQCGIP